MMVLHYFVVMALFYHLSRKNCSQYTKSFIVSEVAVFLITTYCFAIKYDVGKAERLYGKDS